MPRIVIGTNPIKLAHGNPKRKKWEFVFTPSSIIAGNTGVIFIKRGSAPVASSGSNSWDYILNAGAQAGDNLDDNLLECPWKGDVWAISDTAAQEAMFNETNIPEESKT